ncbi:Pentatricopeptide repeat-containing protein [Actinidia chinensis var. chinensis]|uniref:Pentatricopeptide repeat-containing protein n=1 Tax=Actinidia chinensis var. chinensis TaxID=1590841 RepID=A0A2R6QC09_ACTCC|nr:Pentatricopeptide repeat-containing protein [Actinidia chinensis var. chinensis]
MRKAASSPFSIFSFTKTLSPVPFQQSFSHHTVAIQPFSNGEQNHQRIIHLLQEIPRLGSFDATKSLHALAIRSGSNFPQPIFINNNIIQSYVLLGQLLLARKVFDKMPQRNVVSYNSMIGAYGRNGSAEEAWNLFSEMRGCGFEPTQFTFGGLLSCVALDLYSGYQLQGLIIKNGLFYADAFAGTALLGLFGRLSCVDEALRAFDDMPQKNLVTWNSMISLFGHHGFVEASISLFRELVRIGGALSEYSYVGALSGLVSEQDMESGEQLHGLLIKNGLGCKVLVSNALISIYVNCCGPYTAEKLFWEGPFRDIVSWNMIIGALAKSDKPGKSLQLFMKMCSEGVWPNQTTFVSVINSCTSSQNLMHGKLIHATTIKYKFGSDVFVGSALVDLYAKHNELEDARHCFDDIDAKNVVPWNALIWGYSQKRTLSSVLLLREMIQSGYCPNEFSVSAALKSSVIVELQQLHSLIMKLGYDQNEYVSCSLITSYAKNGLLSDAFFLVPDTNTPPPAVPTNIIAGLYNKTRQYHKAQELYSLLEEPDIVSWNILIASCSRNGDFKEAFELFGHMLVDYIYPDKYTYVSLLSICTKLCNLALGTSVHGLIIKTNLERCDTFVYNIMIDMYGKCGSLESSLKVFNEIKDKNLISWTALISSLGLYGHADEALQRFGEMEVVGFRPDAVAFIAVLSACRYGGLVSEGKKLFGEMKTNYGIQPDMNHYQLMVDLLSRYGHLKEAEHLILGMPFPPNALIWRSFLESCKRQHGAENLAVEHINVESNR